MELGMDYQVASQYPAWRPPISRATECWRWPQIIELDQHDWRSAGIGLRARCSVTEPLEPARPRRCGDRTRRQEFRLRLMERLISNWAGRLQRMRKSVFDYTAKSGAGLGPAMTNLLGGLRFGDDLLDAGTGERHSCSV
jgi:hypothetical protein